MTNNDIPSHREKSLSNLKVHYASAKPVPHKVILLLAISDLLESGSIVRNEKGMTDEIKEAFEVRLNRYVPRDSYGMDSVFA